MTIKSRTVLCLALGSLLALVVTSVALGSHVRPSIATPTQVAIVPASAPCGSPNSKHGTPLDNPSCSTVAQTSAWLTLGTPEVNGFPAAGHTNIKLRVFCNSANPSTSPTTPVQQAGATPPCLGTAGDQEDVSIEVCAGGRCQFPTGPPPAGTTDVRCKVATAPATPCAAGAGTPYSGLIVGVATIQITDHYNALEPNPGTGCSATTSCTGTVTPLPFPVGAQCSAGNCKYLTTADAVVPNVVKEDKKAVIELGQILVFDGGSTGSALDNPKNPGHCPPACIPNAPGGAGLFAVQGLYLP